MAPDDPPSTPPGTPPTPTPRPRCPGTVKSGVRCIAMLRAGESYCYNHDPARAAERAAAGAIRHQPGDLGTELGTLNGIARKTAHLLGELETGITIKTKTGKRRFVAELDPKVANARLNALRFLAALVRLRTIKEGEGKILDAPFRPSSVEELVG